MRTSAAARDLCRKLISTFFAATLALGLVPVAAFAEPAAVAAESSGAADASFTTQREDESPRDEDPVITGESQDEAVATGSIPSDGEEGTEDNAATGDDAQASVPAGVINQTMPLETVAQQESTRSYFLAQTLESTKTVPIVSANLPLDKGTNQGPQAGADGGTTVGSEDRVTDGDPSASTEGDGGSEPEEGDDSDESDLGTSGGDGATPGVSSESTVVGSFTYLGMTFAVEPGGESVALMAADYAKLPSEFVENQVVVIPDIATSDGTDYYTVARIADNVFASFKEESANPDFLGAEALVNELSEEGDPAVDEERANPLEGRAGILLLGIPASIMQVEDDAFTGFDTLQYVVASEDNPTYGTYDGCLYDAELTSLLLIPEGRLGAVRIAPNTTAICPEAFSHCAVDTALVDPDSAASQLLEGSDFLKATDEYTVLKRSNADEISDLSEGFNPLYSDIVSVLSLGEIDQWTIGLSERSSYAAVAYRYATYPCTEYIGISLGTTGSNGIIRPFPAYQPEEWPASEENFTVNFDANYGLWMWRGPNNGNRGYWWYTPAPQSFSRSEFGRDLSVGATTNYEEYWIRDYTEKTIARWLVNGGSWSDGTDSIRNTEVSQWPDGATYYTFEVMEAPSIRPSETQAFAGWLGDDGTTLLWPGETTTQIKAQKYTAQWKDGWTVYLDHVFGSGTIDSFAALNEDLKLKPIVDKPTRSEYVFGGYFEQLTDGTKNFWYDADGGLIESGEGDQYRFSEALKSYPLESDVTLYADWVRDITLDAQGGSDDGQKLHVTWNAPMPSMAITGFDACVPGETPGNHGEAVLRVPARISNGKEMFRFNGFWADPISETDASRKYYEAVDDGSGNLKLQPVAGRTWDIDQSELYAHWIADIDWQLNGITDANASTYPASVQNVTGDDYFCSVTAPDPGHRNGYTFAGWKVAYADGTADSVLYRVDETIPIKGHCTIEAQWSPVEYTISFDLGELNYDNQRVMFNDPGTGAGIVSGTYASNAETSAGQKFTASVKWNVDDGTLVIPSFTKSGYTLESWTVVSGPSGTDASGSLGSSVEPGATFTTGDAATDHFRGDFALVANWTEAEQFPFARKVQIDGNVSDAMTYDSDNPKYNETGSMFPATYDVVGFTLNDGAMAEDTKPGYTFVGWRAYAGGNTSNGVLVDAADGVTEVANPLEPALNVAIPSGRLAADKLTLVACFTTDYHGLIVDLGTVPDANVNLGKNWIDASSGSDNTAFSFQTTGVKENEAANQTKQGYGMNSTVIALPTPSRAGQSFEGWKLQTYDEADPSQRVDVGEGSEAFAAVLGSTTATAFTVSAEHLANYYLTALWKPSEYSIEFENFEHIEGAYAIGGKGAGAAVASYALDGDDLTNGKTVRVLEVKPASAATQGDPTFDDVDEVRYTAFIGWELPDGSVQKTVTVDQSNLATLFDSDGKLKLRAKFTLKEYTAKLDLNGGKLDADVAAAGGWTKDAIRSDVYTRSYTCETGAFQLPVQPKRYGYRFLGWTLYVDGEVDHGFIETTVDGVSGWWQNADVVGERTYRVEDSQWEPQTAYVKFDRNLPSDFVENVPATVGPARVLVTMGALPEGKLASIEGSANYDFLGYFDTPASTGGKQYYTATGAGARAWDKALFEEDGTTPIEHTLYARWAKKVPAGTAPENEPKTAEIVRDPDGAVDEDASSRATVHSKAGAGQPVASTPAFDGFYNGRYTHGADGTVTVSVDSYVWANGMTAESVYKAFNAAHNVVGEYLCGFVIDDTGDTIALSALANDEAFEFRFKAADLANEELEKATFTLAGTAVTALYSDVPYDFSKNEGGEPPTHDPIDGKSVIFATFDANGGTIGGKLSSTSSFIYQASDPYVKLPMAPTREGFRFVGWSTSPIHVDGDHYDALVTGDDSIFKVKDILKKTYYAHWEEKGYQVFFDKNYGTGAVSQKTIVFGSTESLDAMGVNGELTNREGYFFLGYFDERAGGVQRFDSSGAATGAWSRTHTESEPGITLYAHWMADPAAGTMPEPSKPETPSKDDPVDPGELFPGKKPTVVIPTNDNERSANMAARAGDGTLLTALDGVYDGLYAEAPGDAAGTTLVAIVMNSYTPADVVDDTVADKMLSLRKVIAAFEEHAGTEGEYLQGFRVVSTGRMLTVADLAAGCPVTIDAMKDDLAAATPASFRFADGTASVPVVEAVYGPTQPIKPGDWTESWPVEDDPTTSPANEATRIYNTFDARGGVFVERNESGDAVAQRRFAAVPSGYKQAIELPANPVYALDATYHFDGWYTAEGVQVFDENGTLMDPSYALQGAAANTFYARYVRTYYTFTLHDSNDGVTNSAHHKPDAEDWTRSFNPYQGETLALMTADFAANVPDARDGHDLVGYFYEDAEGMEHPFYLTSNDYVDYGAYKTELANCNASWENLPGIGDNVTLYAKWIPMTFKVKWVYNWNGRDYEYAEPDEDGVMVPMPYDDDAELVSVPFGSEIEVPTIHNPGYYFKGWYAGTDAAKQVTRTKVDYSGYAGTNDNNEMFSTESNSRDGAWYFVARDLGEGVKHCFEPHNIADLDARGRTVTLFACFDENRRETYEFRIYLAKPGEQEHGSFDDSLWNKSKDPEGGRFIRQTYTYGESKNMVVDYEKANLIGSDTGYTLLDWWCRVNGGEELIRKATIDAGTTGLREFFPEWSANDYAIGFTFDTLDIADEPTLTRPTGNIEGEPAALEPNLNETSTITFPVLEDVVDVTEVPRVYGYALAGWMLWDSERGFLPATKDNPNSLVTPGQAVDFTADYVAQVFGAASATGKVTYGAVWEPVVYDVRFHVMRSTEDGQGELFDSCTLQGARSGGAAEGDAPSSLVLPYPHTNQVTNVFKNWSLVEGGGYSGCSGWTSGGEPLKLTDIFRVMYARGMSATTNTIDMYAVWGNGTGINVDMPLMVNVLIDPWRPTDETYGKVITNSANSYYTEDDAWVSGDASGAHPAPAANVKANAWVGTVSENDTPGVRIESLTFERGDESVFEGGSAADLDLLVYAGREGETMYEPLRVNFGNDYVVYLRDDATGQHDHVDATAGARTNLAGLGFDKTITSTSPLLLYYDIDFSRALRNGNLGYLTTLANDSLNPDGSPRTLAKLYYTIGVAQDAKE